jgi:hypothetical protein
MSEYLIYGKRQGQLINGVPTYDKTFRALNSSGIRVTKLEEAMSYATREDAQEVINKKGRSDCIFEIRKAK